jgi:DNA-binding response OmpR family regulator
MTDRPTVAIVEDERQLADLYAEWLSEEYEVRTAYRADEAMKVIDDDVDILLLDRRLPAASGDDILADVRDRGIECQVAMVTAVDPDFDIIDMGFDDYVVKPLEREDLRELVKRLLTRGLYNDEVREYFSLVSKRANLETAKSPTDLADDERYQELEAEIEALEDRLDDIVDQLEDEDFGAVLRTLQRPDSAHGTDPGSG